MCSRCLEAGLLTGDMNRVGLAALDLAVGRRERRWADRFRAVAKAAHDVFDDYMCVEHHAAWESAHNSESGGGSPQGPVGVSAQVLNTDEGAGLLARLRSFGV